VRAPRPLRCDDDPLPVRRILAKGRQRLLASAGCLRNDWELRQPSWL
jgi:hypothetical protein